MVVRDAGKDCGASKHGTSFAEVL